MKDVQKAVSEAKAMYERSKTSEARIWLDKLSSRIMLYGTVLDTLSQHHAEYVSLVWGAIKFMLVVSNRYPSHSSSRPLSRALRSTRSKTIPVRSLSSHFLSRPFTRNRLQILVACLGYS